MWWNECLNETEFSYTVCDTEALTFTDLSDIPMSVHGCHQCFSVSFHTDIAHPYEEHIHVKLDTM